MADYKELIRKAIQALPENNGAARRAVYEKARAALVGQLRGLNPPLAARDITQHRLQLEDCIRQVEQETSEAVIAGLKLTEDAPAVPQQPALPPPRLQGLTPPRAANASRPAPSPARPAAPARPQPASLARPAASAPVRPAAAPIRPASTPQVLPRVAAGQPKSAAAVAAMPQSRPTAAARPLPRGQAAAYPRPVPAPEPEPEYVDDAPETIEDIIAAAESDTAIPYDNDEVALDTPAPREPEGPPERPAYKLEPRVAARKPALAPPSPVAPPRVESRLVPSIVARAEAAKSGRHPARPVEALKRSNGAEPARRDGAHAPRLTPPPAGDAAEDQLVHGRHGNSAMSSVREVEVEPVAEGDPQVAIERAIATLEREARNDGEEGGTEHVLEDEPANGRAGGAGRRRPASAEKPFRDAAASPDAVFARAPVENERGGGSAVTIFLLVFLVLLIAAGGAGFWAWREGYIDFDAMFGKAAPAVEQSSTPPAAIEQPTASPAASKPAAATPAPASVAGTNTEPAPNTPAQSAEALSSAPTPAVPAATPAAEPSAQTQAGPKSEDRLTTPANTPAANAANAAPGAGGTASAAATGSQSLLLEASQDGTTGAVPFSGTVEWSKSTDEMGQPVLVGKANIPARNLGVSVLIRKNTDATLPASHLMEINFTVNDSFIGGAISGLPGVLLKNEELVQGTPLVGASARVQGNQFLFALSSSAADEATNKDLLTSRKWMDLAIIYATGKKAIITLEKDDKAEALFNEVFATWSKEPAVTPATAAAPAAAVAPAAN